MNYSKLTKAKLIQIINGLVDELEHVQKDVGAEVDSDLPWEEQPVVEQVQAKSHAEIMAVRMAAAKAQAMSTGRAVKA